MERRPPAARLRLLLLALLPLAGLSACTDECDTRSDCDEFNTATVTYTCEDNRCVAESRADGGADAGTSADGGSDAGTADAGTGPTDGGVALRVLHAAPDAPAVDVYAQGSATPLATGVNYRATSAYVTVAPGTYTLELRPAGAAPTSAAAFTSAPVTLVGGERVTAMAAGRLSSTDASDALRVVPLVERFDTPGPNEARVRVVHAGADAPAVDVDLGDDGTAEVTGLQRFASTGEAGVNLPSGQALRVGISAGGSKVTSFTTPALPAGARAFAVAAGLLSAAPGSPEGFGLLLLDESGVLGFVQQDPRLYVLHASPDAPAVDAFVGPLKVVNDASFGGLAGPVSLPPGSATVDLFPHDASPTRPSASPAATGTTGALAAGKEYLLLVTGFLSTARSQPLQLLTLEAAFTPRAPEASVRAVHAAPDAPAVDFGTVTGGALTPVPGLTNLSYGTASAAEGVAVSATQSGWGVAATGTTTPAATANFTPTSGGRSFLVAAGLLGPGTGEPGLQLWNVDVGTTPWTTAVMPPMP
jgi:hypothetical protein